MIRMAEAFRQHADILNKKLVDSDQLVLIEGVSGFLFKDFYHYNCSPVFFRSANDRTKIFKDDATGTLKSFSPSKLIYVLVITAW